MGFLNDCIDVMIEAHGSDQRMSGGLYIQHPIAVASIYRRFYPQDFVGQGGCLVHDGLEESFISVRSLRGFLGRELASMVEALTKRRAEEFRCREDRLNEYYGRVFFAARRDKRTGLVKLVDRYENLLTVEVHGYEKAMKILDETERVWIRFFRELRLPLTEQLAWLCYQKRLQLSAKCLKSSFLF